MCRLIVMFHLKGFAGGLIAGRAAEWGFAQEKRDDECQKGERNAEKEHIMEGAGKGVKYAMQL